MVKWFIWLLIASTLFGSCKRVGIEQENNPNGLFTPVLTAIRNGGAVTLKWAKPACSFCLTCPCPQLEPDQFEILFSETGISDFRKFVTVKADVFETTIGDLTNGKPYYFAVRAVISGKKFTESFPVMTIPETPERINSQFEVTDKDAQSGSWSPDQLSMAYVGNYFWNNGNNMAKSIFIYKSEGNASLLVAKNASSPEWAPKGNRIVYNTDDGEISNAQGHRPAHIAISDVDKASQTRLTSGDSFNYLPTWSPDENWIAYLSDRAGGEEFNIWKIPSTGGTATQVTSDFKDLGELAIINDRSPKTLSWSNDGKSIAYARMTKSSRGINRDIYTVSSSGGNSSTLITSPWNDYCPAYSPDGKAIAFLSDRSGTPQIWLMELQTKNLRQLTGSWGKSVYENGGKIEWSKSADKILFTSNTDQFLSLYSVELR